MSGLRFDFQKLILELEAFSRLAEPFLLSQSRPVLGSLKGFLEQYRAEPTDQKRAWQVTPAAPLLTNSGRGYEKGNKGGKHSIFGEITFIWEIQRIPGRSKRQPAEYFELNGIASTKVRLLCESADGAEPKEIAMWRMEIGDTKSPGCHFHIQILGQSTGFPFPSSLSVPRLPNLMVTPLAAAEFALAELFQDDWARHVARNGPHLQRWSNIQRERWNKLLNWKLDLVNKSTNPWTAIKAAKPEASLFS
ncbi:hypothetical protein ACVIIW_001481 [Bradyrhizobium sp. USDA 4449]